ncbi:hypothetical protein [Saccharomonospora sp. CUA-673]|uniref:hypothetical protein n=1 Tax=Saccharomonospora sp. CUA-673 TaxID=1904969 RepID=UPI002100A835|nr:hypothetical protein [Saccharomonospora sp. CUA-673]
MSLSQSLADIGDLDEQVQDLAGMACGGTLADPLGDFGQNLLRGNEIVGHVRVWTTAEQSPGSCGDRPDLAQDDFGNTVPSAEPRRSQR